jgi:hypothetical protein
MTTYLASLAFALACVAAGLPNAPEAAPAPEPLSTSCQCPAIACGNGSTELPCQVTCPGTAVCSCATCVMTGKISYASGPSSCVCQSP